VIITVAVVVITKTGAAVLGVKVKATVKESEDGEFVLRTVDRSRLWEVQTPQVGGSGMQPDSRGLGL